MKFISYCFKALSPAVSKFLVILSLAFSFSACQWGDEIVSIVQPNPDDFAALFSDSSTVRTSTVKIDSFMTGSSNRLFVGRIIDPYLGKMHSNSFFQPTLASAVTLPDKAEYDSLILSLAYDRYYFGDTTKAMNLSVHELKEDMLLKNAYYGDDSTPYDANPLGKLRFYPKPRTPNNTVKIKLSDVLGKKVFDLAKSNQLNSNTDWINLLKGLAVIPGTSDNGAAIGFTSIRSNRTSVQLHYHVPQTEGVSKDSTLFQITALYNQLGGDRSQTVLSKMPANRRIAYPSSQSDELTFIQAGTGIMTRVDLPTVRQLKYNKYTFANRAYLVVTPLRQSFNNTFPADTALYVYYCDKNNEFLQGSDGLPSPLTTLDGTTPVVGQLINDLVTNKQYYRLDLSQYVLSILGSDSEDSPGLLLRSAPINIRTVSYLLPDYDSEFSKRFDRTVIGSQNNSIEKGMKLELYYTTVKAQ